jgi:HlyD family secretion protein
MAFGINGCNQRQDKADAYGNFEVDETIISAQAGGELLDFRVEEGVQLNSGQFIGLIDSTDLAIQKIEIIANKQAVQVQKTSVTAEIKVMQVELKNLIRERNRINKLIKSEAATTKQLDDIEGNITVLESKIQALRNQYILINKQVEVIDAKKDLVNERISRCIIINPIDGVVLTKLAQQHELMAPGKPLYKIADMTNIFLRAYVSEPQLTRIKIGQNVTVAVDEGDGVKTYPGTISWISSESEFTPKIIQTKEERVNLVYAIKIKVTNDGFLKLGMPAHVNF